jgi:hypothetical protein
MHDSGFPSSDESVACVVRSPRGVAFTFGLDAVGRSPRRETESPARAAGHGASAPYTPRPGRVRSRWAAANTTSPQAGRRRSGTSRQPEARTATSSAWAAGPSVRRGSLPAIDVAERLPGQASRR